MSEVEEGEEEYSYVYTSRVCPAQLIRQQGEEEGEEENIYEEIGLHLPLAGPAHPADVQQQSLDASQSHLHLYRSIRSNPTGIIPVRVIPDNDIFNYDQGQMFLGMGNHLGH